jgi:starch synthase
LFNEAKVIYSLHNDEFAEPMSHRLAEKLILEGVDKSYIEDLKNPDYNQITKHALKLSDGVVVHSENINPDFISFAADNNKLVLPFSNPDSFHDDCSNFYDTVLLGESVDEMVA